VFFANIGGPDRQTDTCFRPAPVLPEAPPW
jgi:hypothetical protein